MERFWDDEPEPATPITGRKEGSKNLYE